jgi:hypothetical protein
MTILVDLQKTQGLIKIKERALIGAPVIGLIIVIGNTREQGLPYTLGVKFVHKRVCLDKYLRGKGRTALSEKKPALLKKIEKSVLLVCFKLRLFQ